jgi:hypothetical protein
MKNKDHKTRPIRRAGKKEQKMMIIREEALKNYKNMSPKQFKERMINDLLAHGVSNAEEVASRIINSAKKLNDSGRKRIFRK